MQSDNATPYPINIDGCPKLFDYVLTANGLIYFQTLKRNHVIEKDLVLDEFNKLRLLCVFYATANKILTKFFHGNISASF
jgi:hypothetical protein